MVSTKEINHQSVTDHDGVVANISVAENHHGDSKQHNEFISHEHWAFLVDKGIKQHLMDVHLWTRSIHFYFYFFFRKSRLCLGGRVRLKSRRELKDFFCKIKENKCQDYCEKCEK